MVGCVSLGVALCWDVVKPVASSQMPHAHHLSQRTRQADDRRLAQRDTTFGAAVGPEELSKEIVMAELRAIAFDPTLEHQLERVMHACAIVALKEGPKLSLYLADVRLCVCVVDVDWSR